MIHESWKGMFAEVEKLAPVASVEKKQEESFQNMVCAMLESQYTGAFNASKEVHQFLERLKASKTDAEARSIVSELCRERLIGYFSMSALAADMGITAALRTMELEDAHE